MANDLTLEKILLDTAIPVQYDLALLFIEMASPAWTDYFRGKEDESFYDGVGNHYIVKHDILARACTLISKEKENPGSQNTSLDELLDEFIGPILSIDRMDWEPAYAAERVFCACYNLLLLYTMRNRATENAQLNIVINQAADAMLRAQLKTLEELNVFVTNLRNNHKKTEINRSSDSLPPRAEGKVE